MATSPPSTRARRERVVLVGQSRLVVETIGRSLSADVHVLPVPLEACTTMAAGRDSVLRSRPTLVALVVAPTDRVDPCDLVAELAARGQRVVVVGTFPDPAIVAELVAAGAADVLEGGSLAGLVRLVEKHAGGDHPTARPKATRPAAHGAHLTEDRRARRNLSRLTAAEARTLWRLMHGSSVAEISQLHVVSVETVRSHIRGLLTKLDSSSQLAAVALAWRVGWQPPLAALRAA